MRKLTTWQKTVRHWNNWEEGCAYEESKTHIKAAIQKRLEGIPLELQRERPSSDGYQENSKLRYSGYAQAQPARHHNYVQQIKNRRE